MQLCIAPIHHNREEAIDFPSLTTIGYYFVAHPYGGAGITLYWFSPSLPWEVIASSRLSPAVTVTPGSSSGALEMVQATQRMTASQGHLFFTFRRPSSSAAEVAILVQSSSDLKQWSPVNLPAQVVQSLDGMDEIRIAVPPPAGPEGAHYFRLQLVTPDPVADP